MDQPAVAQELIFAMAAVVAVMEEKAAAVVGAAVVRAAKIRHP